MNIFLGKTTLCTIKKKIIHLSGLVLIPQKKIKKIGRSIFRLTKFPLNIH